MLLKQKNELLNDYDLKICRELLRDPVFVKMLLFGNGKLLNFLWYFVKVFLVISIDKTC